MTDLIAAAAAVFLLVVAVRLVVSLQHHRGLRRQALLEEQRHGRTVIAQLPTGADFTIFSEDTGSFYHGGRPLAKDAIVGVRLLVNDVAVAAYGADASATTPDPGARRSAEGSQDRWDVAIATRDRMTVVECGAIRERVSQELAGKIFDAVKHALAHRERQK